MVTKIIKTYSIDKNIFIEFRRLCDEKSINQSKFIVNKIKEWIDFVNEIDKTEKKLKSSNNSGMN